MRRGHRRDDLRQQERHASWYRDTGRPTNGRSRLESLDPIVAARGTPHNIESRILTTGQRVRSDRCVISTRWRTFVSVAALVATAAAPAHDVAFWRAVAQAKYAPPPGSDIPALTDELTVMLSSPDPELRDDIAYSTLTSWIYQQKILDADALRPLVERLLANMRRGIGEQGTDSVFGRSFSTLMLSVIVARDNADRLLDAGAWRRIESAALAYLADEQDLRGYDPDKGWMHSAAHTADLLKFLGRSRYLDAAGQRQLLDAISDKLAKASVVFTYGEDERLARAVLSLIARSDFSASLCGFHVPVRRTTRSPRAAPRRRRRPSRARSRSVPARRRRTAGRPA